mgnify:CR=1 FL=1
MHYAGWQDPQENGERRRFPRQFSLSSFRRSSDWFASPSTSEKVVSALRARNRLGGMHNDSKCRGDSGDQTGILNFRVAESSDTSQQTSREAFRFFHGIFPAVLIISAPLKRCFTLRRKSRCKFIYRSLDFAINSFVINVDCLKIDYDESNCIKKLEIYHKPRAFNVEVIYKF